MIHSEKLNSVIVNYCLCENKWFECLQRGFNSKSAGARGGAWRGRLGGSKPPDTGKLRGAEIPYHNFFFFLYQIFFLDNYFFRIIWNECKRKNHQKWSKNIFAPILMKKMFHMFQRILRKYIIYILYFLTIFLRNFFFHFLESSETYGNNFH